MGCNQAEPHKDFGIESRVVWCVENRRVVLKFILNQSTRQIHSQKNLVIHKGTISKVSDVE